jgi:hypothetical protein
MRAASMWTVVLAASLSPGLAAPEPAADRAAAVLKEAREALGGAARLEAVRALSATGPFRRVIPEPGGDPRELDGETSIDVLRPARYLRQESLSFLAGAPPVTIATGLDGDQAWTGPVGGGGGGRVMIRVGEGAANAPEALRKRVEADVARWLLATTLLVSAEHPLTFTHAGQAEAPDGRADVLDVRGTDGFEAQLFVDTSTRRPFMLTFKESPPRMAFRAMRPGGPAPGHAAPEVAPAPAAPVEARLFVSEWKKVGEVWLPHLVTKTLEGGPTEEFQIKSWRVDPAFAADHFAKKTAAR